MLPLNSRYEFSLILLISTFIFAILDWIAVARNVRKAELILKPAVIVSLLAWLWQTTNFSGPMIWFGIGLVFSLAGDIILNMGSDKFMIGLVCFLLTHVAYIIGLSPDQISLNPGTLILAFLITATTVRIFWTIATTGKTSGFPNLQIPGLVYGVIISLMLFSTLVTNIRVDWQASAALLVGSGGLLFYISDTLLAWNKFVRKIKHAPVLIMSTYHVGQIFIIVGATLQFQLS